MAERRHSYEVSTHWSGATTGYSDFSRDHVLRAPGRPDIAGSSDPAFRGSRDRWNPEQLLVASLSACHKLWFLHLCTEAGIVVTEYVDEAHGEMVEDATGSGKFARVVLRPRVSVRSGDISRLPSLHHAAHEKCFIANSMAFPIAIEPICEPL